MKMDAELRDSPDAVALEALETGKHVGLIRDVLDQLHTGDDSLKWVIFLACLSSGLTEKLHVDSVGKSQSGKSHVEGVMAVVFPKAIIQFINSSSAKALYYEAKEKGRDYFRGKILVLDEFMDNPDTWAIVKALTSADAWEVTHKTVIEQKFAELSIIHPPVVLTNSCEPPSDVQINNRFIIGNVDESPEQDQRVRELQDREAMFSKFSKREQQKVDIVRAILAKLLEEKDAEVLIPFAELLEFRSRAPRVNFPKLLRLVKAACYLNRFQRRRIDGASGPYVATEADGAEAFRLWKALELYQQLQMDETASAVLREVPDDWCETVEIIDSCKSLGLSGTTVRRKLSQLYAAGFVDRDKGEKFNADLWRNEGVPNLSTVSKLTLKNWPDESKRKEFYKEWAKKAVSQVSQDETQADEWAEYILTPSLPEKPEKVPELARLHGEAVSHLDLENREKAANRIGHEAVMVGLS